MLSSKKATAEENKNRGWPKGKRRFPKGNGAPKQPLSGYVHFLNERREAVKSDNPEISFIDLSKRLASEWSTLPEEEKNKYNEMAKSDKERYDREFTEYQQTESYKQFVESQMSESGSQPGSSASAKKKRSSSFKAISADIDDVESPREEMLPSSISSSALAPSQSGSQFIPIFTEEFIEHNKSREAELRQLRKQASEMEEQNQILGKHIDSMKTAIGKLEVETVQQRQKNANLQQHLESLRQMVVGSFRGFQLPSSSEPLTVNSADQFVTRLLSMVAENPVQHQAIINSAKEIVSRMEYK